MDAPDRRFGGKALFEVRCVAFFRRMHYNMKHHIKPLEDLQCWN